MDRRVFGAHGQFCATHPWEVIVGTLTAAACAWSAERVGARGVREVHCAGWAHVCPGLEAEYQAADAVIMTAVRCGALLYAYYQFCNLHKLGSKYLLGITAVFTVFASFLFTSALINIFWSDIGDLKDAPFLFLLVVDVARGARLAKIAGRAGLARGLALLGPLATLDTVLEMLLVGVGALSGIPRLEHMCTFACLALLVNYLVFITFYPACLALVMELSKTNKVPNSQLLLQAFQVEQEYKPNPVVQRVKLIMSAGLLGVHLRSRWSMQYENNGASSGSTITSPVSSMNHTQDTLLLPYVRWFSMSADHIVILILLFALTVKFIFFEEREDLTEEMNRSSDGPTVEDAICNKMMNLQSGDDTSRKAKFEITDVGFECKETQTHREDIDDENLLLIESSDSITNKRRPVQECLEIYRSDLGAALLSDEEVLMLVEQSHIPLYKLEKILGNSLRGVRLRRKYLMRQNNCPSALDTLPYLNYDYSKVLDACCENVIGYVGIPVGYAGPLTLDGEEYMVPMATTEGALVASTNRGAKAIGKRGVTSVVEDIGMTRAPAIRFPNVLRAHDCRKWIDSSGGFNLLKTAFDGTSRFARLQEIHIGVDGPALYVRFRATTGDAMGMNMVSKGAEMALKVLQDKFSDMEIISLSGNYCSDKKAAAINWIKGRGKRVVCETIISQEALKKILKTDAKTLSRCNKMKNLSGSALAGSIGGNNAHAANMVTAIFIATGQDPAQNVTSSYCSTSMEPCGDTNDDLYVTCTMPSLEVGTIGGGTVLSGQSACLELLRVRGAGVSGGSNSARLASLVCATVLAGELSLMAALVNSDLVASHMRHNRSTANMQATQLVNNNTTSKSDTLAPPSSL